MKFLATAHRRALTGATVIAFSLTFALAGFALLFGLLPETAAFLTTRQGPIDTGVVLLVVPLVALVGAIVFQAVRLTLAGPVQMQPPRPARTLTDWQPGRGEG
jgi:hypothetical protein